MKKLITAIIIVAASILSGCKSSCDCYKHSYGEAQPAVNMQNEKAV